jgi:hypothetical protein
MPARTASEPFVKAIFGILQSSQKGSRIPYPFLSTFLPQTIRDAEVQRPSVTGEIVNDYARIGW